MEEQMLTRFDVLVFVIILMILFGNGGPLIPTNIPQPVLACVYLVICIVLLLFGVVRFA